MEIKLKYIIITIISLIFLFLPVIRYLLSKYGIIKFRIKPIIEIGGNGINIYYPKSRNSENINWKDIISIDLTDKNKILKLVLKNKNIKLLRKKEYTNWIDILKAMPDRLKDDNILIFSREYFKDLKTCKVCGKIAVKDNLCLHCHSDQNIDNLEKEQLLWFSIDNKKEKIDFYYDDFVYKTDRNWKPIVTKSDVLNYSLTD